MLAAGHRLVDYVPSVCPNWLQFSPVHLTVYQEVNEWKRQ